MENNNEIFLDVRTPAEFTEVHIPKSISIPLNDLNERKNEILKMKGEIIIVCATGNRAKFAYDFLKKEGVENMKIMEGGIAEYYKQGRKLEFGS